MIKIERWTSNGKEFVRTYSDAGMMIQRNDGVLYCTAIDPADSGRTYTESDRPIKQEAEEM